jgi:hypothetical protein
MMNFLTGPSGRLHLALLLILTGCATTPSPSKQSPSPPTAWSGASNGERTEAVPVVAVDAGNGHTEVSPPPVKTDPCGEERSLGTLDACAGFLRSCPTVLTRQDILAQMCRLIEEQKGGYEDYRKFVLEFEDGLPFVPYRHRLSLTGPEGLRVHDCLESLRRGTESGMVLEKVRMRKGVYSDFTDDEIDTLKQMGLTSDLIQAMLESTHDAKRAERALLKNVSVGASPAGGQSVRMRGDEMYSSVVQQPAQAPASGGYVPSAGDTLANCAAQTLALEGCKHLSGLARSVCNATAKAQFPCQ